MADDNILHQKWVRSYEEDTEKEIVFRPETFNFPLRRGGREAIDLKADRTFIQRESGPDDRYCSREGNWNIEGENVSAGQSITLESGKHQIIALMNDKLVLSK